MMRCLLVLGAIALGVLAFGNGAEFYGMLFSAAIDDVTAPCASTGGGCHGDLALRR